MEKFQKEVLEKISNFSPESILEAGCGEGFIISQLESGLKVGIDISCDAIKWADEHWEGTHFLCGDIFHLPFKNNSFDLVLSLEVLEHLEEPEKALNELKRVAGKEIIISVPHEPYFRLGNFFRGKYLTHLGNHPEHIQQFTGKKFRKFMGSGFKKFEVLGSFPWLIGIGYL